MRELISSGHLGHSTPNGPLLLFVEDENLSELLAISIGSFGSDRHRLAAVRDHRATDGLVRATIFLAFVGQGVSIYLLDSNRVILRIAGDLDVLAVVFCNVAGIDHGAV